MREMREKGKLADMLFLSEHSFQYLQDLAEKWDLHRKYSNVSAEESYF